MPDMDDLESGALMAGELEAAKKLARQLKPLTPSDYNSLRYFFFEKGDMTRWTGWEEAEPKLRAAHPDLFIALNLYASARAHLRRIVDEITRPVEESGVPLQGEEP